MFIILSITKTFPITTFNLKTKINYKNNNLHLCYQIILRKDLIITTYIKLEKEWIIIMIIR